MERIVTNANKIKIAPKPNLLRKQKGYWQNNDNIYDFLSEIKEIYNLNSPEDWNSITSKQIISNGGNSLLSKFSVYELKCLACPEGKSIFNNPKQASGHWDNKENVLKFLSKLKEKYNLNTLEDWNSINSNHIKSNGGKTLLNKYSMYELKCMAFPEGKSIFNNPKLSKPAGYWENKENILKFLSKLKEKYNLNTPGDWKSINYNHIKSNGGKTLLNKYSMFELKCMACPEGKSIFNNPKLFKPAGYWENKKNILQFLSELKEKYNLNTPEDWNLIGHKQIKAFGGWTLLKKYSINEIKCMACPEGKAMFNTNQFKPPGYWSNKENILQFLSEIKEKYNLNTPEDWNSITSAHILSEGGSRVFAKCSMYDLKCLACPEGKSIFNKNKQPAGYWDNKENINNFFEGIKQKYNLNTPEDWNSITQQHIQSNGGRTLLSNLSMYELKCMACPEGKSIFTNPPQPASYWDNKENILQFISKLKEKYNLNTPEDWKRISKHQIVAEGGWGLINGKKSVDIKLKFEDSNGNVKFVPFSKLFSKIHKRSSQRWLFLQIRKLFPDEEIVEDYFHSEISRISGFNVQFDIFMIERNIAIEYHGIQHYEDIPGGFSNVETYQNRDLEKEKLCSEHGIQLIVIPYWWDNKLDSLKSFLYSKINLK